MRPAFSVIFFTTLSGAGFGLLIWLSLYDLLIAAGFIDARVHVELFGLTAFIAYFLGFALAVGGLLLSSLHLANVKNAYKAFREWRSSWLSREAVMAVIALCCLGAEAFARIFLGIALAPLGLLGAVGCLATVFSTAMIYAQLKTVSRWNTPLTPALFLLLALLAGAIMLGSFLIAMLLLSLSAFVQIFHWVHGDTAFVKQGNTIENATGLGKIGKVRLFEPPHTGENYLLHEMVYRVARKHARKLRFIAFVFAFIIPALFLAAAQMITQSQGLEALLFVKLLALFNHGFGVFVSRWLFFAQAEHSVSLYYGR